MEKDFEKVYILKFSEHQLAADALNSMQFTYHSPLYGFYVNGTCTPAEHVVIFPEEAKELLSVELQKKQSYVNIQHKLRSLSRQCIVS